MNKPVFYIVFFLYSLLSSAAAELKAQENLVPNGSFEEYNICPQNIGDFNCLNWFSPTNETPDFYTPCASLNGSGSPSNSYGYQIAKDGKSYVGLTLNSNDGYREYIGAELSELLITNCDYKISFYISSSDLTKYGSNNLEILFVENLTNLNTEIQMSGTAIILNSLNTVGDSDILYDTSDWISINYDYTAKGGEKYLIIGNFKSQIETSFGINNGNGIDSYYYIDDIRLEQNIKIPNVFTPNGDNVNDIFFINGLKINSFYVLNRWGNCVYMSENIIAWDGTSSGNLCTEGIYYYFIEYKGQDNLKLKKTGFVQLIR